MSRANTGSSAVAPPSSTANISSVIAARITGVCQMKRAPASSDSRLSGSAAAGDGARAQEAEQQRHQQQQAPGAGVDPRGPAPDREQQAAQRRAEDRRRLPGAARPGGGAGVVGGRHHLRAQGAEGRALEGARHADAEQQA